jgi:predicted transcriptional regulator of viral defense system
MFTPAEAETCLETKEQGYKKRRWNDMYVERAVILSHALRVLTATAIRVYLIFLTKRQMQPIQGKKGKSGGKRRYVVANQGEIQFTYREAQEKYGISRNAFRSAIDQLVAVGLIDIARTGSGLHRDVTLYSISERWRLYGTPEFVIKTRAKRSDSYGFAKSNSYGRRKISTCVVNT